MCTDASYKFMTHYEHWKLLKYPMWFPDLKNPNKQKKQTPNQQDLDYFFKAQSI